MWPKTRDHHLTTTCTRERRRRVWQHHAEQCLTLNASATRTSPTESVAIASFSDIPAHCRAEVLSGCPGMQYSNKIYILNLDAILTYAFTTEINTILREKSECTRDIDQSHLVTL
jgi:hypothetical protein